MSAQHRLFSGHRVVVPKGQSVTLETFGTIDPETGNVLEQPVDPPFTFTPGIWMIVIGSDNTLTFWKVSDEHFAPMN